MIPRDRLLRAGATTDEVDQMEALPELEIASIEVELQPLADSGVREFVERYRRAADSAREVEAEASPDLDVDTATFSSSPPSPDSDLPKSSGNKPGSPKL